jgi:hypothetical protein
MTNDMVFGQAAKTFGKSGWLRNKTRSELAQIHILIEYDNIT